MIRQFTFPEDPWGVVCNRCRLTFSRTSAEELFLSVKGIDSIVFNYQLLFFFFFKPAAFLESNSMLSSQTGGGPVFSSGHNVGPPSAWLIAVSPAPGTVPGTEQTQHTCVRSKRKDITWH